MQSQIILNGFSREELLADITALVRSEIQAIPKPEKIKAYLSIDEVCELVDLSKQTVYTMTHKKQIPHIKRGGKLLFNRLEIIGWLESSKQNVGQ
jgi:excisionase family DNA binding protein